MDQLPFYGVIIWMMKRLETLDQLLNCSYFFGYLSKDLGLDCVWYISYRVIAHYIFCSRHAPRRHSRVGVLAVHSRCSGHRDEGQVAECGCNMVQSLDIFSNYHEMDEQTIKDCILFLVSFCFFRALIYF